MPIDFPNSASFGHTFTSNNNTWIYDNEKWNLVTSINPTGPIGPTGPAGISYTNENYYAYFMSANTTNNILSINTSIPAGNYVAEYGNFDNAFILNNNVYMNETFSDSVPIMNNRYISLSESVNNITLYNLLNNRYSNGFYNGSTNTIGGFIHDGTSYLAASSSSGIRASTNFITWTTRTSGFGAISCNSIFFGNSLYVACGGSGKIETSTDSITWNAVTSNFGTSAINALTYGNGVYVAVGAGGTITTSTDASTWTTRTSNTTSTLISVAYGNGVYVAVGAGGTITTSTDASTWTTRTSNTTSTLNSVAYGNSVFGITGDSGVIKISTNGTTWTNSTSQLDITSSLISNRNLAFSNGIFVTASRAIGSSRGWDNLQDFQGTMNFSVSTDLNNWVIHRTSVRLDSGEVLTTDTRRSFNPYYVQSTDEFCFGSGFGEMFKYGTNDLKTNTEEVIIILHKISNIAT